MITQFGFATFVHSPGIPLCSSALSVRQRGAPATLTIGQLKMVDVLIIGHIINYHDITDHIINRICLNAPFADNMVQLIYYVV